MSVVTKALSDKLPKQKTPLSKRQINILSAVLGGVGIGNRVAATKPLK